MTHYKILLGLFIISTASITASTANAQDGGFEEIDLTDFSIDVGNDQDVISEVLDEVEYQVTNDTSVDDLVVEPANTELTAPEVNFESSSVVEEIAPTPKAIPHSGTYYDSNSIGANVLGGNASSPREVDPKYEPGSRFVVVQKAAASGSSAARIVAAQRAINLERYASALEMYKGLYKESPKNQRILMGLAVAQQGSGFTESAIATYEELLALNPNHVDASTNMLGLIRMNYPSIAYSRLQELWSKNRNNPNIAAELGLASAKLEQYEEAVRYLGVAASLSPNNASYLYNLAVIYDRVGNNKEALKLYEQSLQIAATYDSGSSIDRGAVYDRMAYLRRL